MSPNQ